MGSLNPDGTPILKANNTSSFRHLGHIIKERRSEDDTLVSTAAASGERRLDGISTSGVAFKSDSTFVYVSGLSLELRNADTSVELEKYTVDGSTSGELGWQAVRSIGGTHVSVSQRQQAPSSPNAPRTVTEEKIFFLDSDRGKSSGFADLTIFSASGVAVGDPSGTTRIDITPAATFDNTPGETPV